jgi:hypothetical protein
MMTVPPFELGASQPTTIVSNVMDNWRTVTTGPGGDTGTTNETAVVDGEVPMEFDADTIAL